MKMYGVRMTLPENNSLKAEHLLGSDFISEKWFQTKEERDQFLNSYQTEYIYSRRGDKPTFEYELIEK